MVFAKKGFLYTKALCFDKCSRNSGKIQLQNCEFTLLFGAKRAFFHKEKISPPLVVDIMEEELFLCRRISRN